MFVVFVVLLSVFVLFFLLSLMLPLVLVLFGSQTESHHHYYRCVPKPGLLFVDFTQPGLSPRGLGAACGPPLRLAAQEGIRASQVR